MTTIDTLNRKNALTVYETRQVQNTYQGLQNQISNLKAQRIGHWIAIFIISVAFGLTFRFFHNNTQELHGMIAAYSKMVKELNAKPTPQPDNTMRDHYKFMSEIKDKNIEIYKERIANFERRIEAYESIVRIQDLRLELRDKGIVKPKPQNYVAPAAPAVFTTTSSNCYSATEEGCQPINFKEMK